MISIRYEKCDPEGCGDSIRLVSFLLGAPDLFPAAPSPSPRSPHILSSRTVSLFFVADHSGARVTSIVGRYSTINSASALTRIYRVARDFVQRTEETSPSMSSSCNVSFCFAVAKSHPSFGFTVFLRNLFLPLVARNPVSTLLRRACSRSRKIHPPARLFVRGPRYYFANKSRAIRCGIKRHRGQRYAILRERIAFNLSLLP